MALKNPLFQQNDTTDQSADVARLLQRDLMNERPGIVQANAMKVVQRAAGANNSVDVGAGAIIIPGTSVANQGHYYVVNDSTVNVPMSTPAHGTLPRIDTVIVAVRDQFYSGSNNDAQFVYVAGTAAASPSPPDIAAAGHNNYWRLANISVPANDNTIITADITDVRTSASVIPAQGHATAVGGCIVCTSTSRPTTPRSGQLIWETDTKRLLVNEDTPDTPNWQPISHNNTWTTFTPSFTNVTLGGGSSWGSYVKLGRTAFIKFSFDLGASGNVTGRIIWTPPSAVALSASAAFAAAGFAVAAQSGGNRWGGVGTNTDGTSISRFSSDSTVGTDGWNATEPFNWAASDAFRGMAIYETAT